MKTNQLQAEKEGKMLKEFVVTYKYDNEVKTITTNEKGIWILNKFYHCDILNIKKIK